MKKPKRMKKEDLDKFKRILLLKRQYLMGDKDKLENEALRRSRQDASGDLTNIPTHMADISADTFEQDLTLGLIENEEEEMWQIDEALERIENKTFGICEQCGCTIKKARLLHIPHAKLCIECKRQEELLS